MNKKRWDFSSFSWSEIAYGVIVIGFILYMIIEAVLNGRGGNEVEFW